MDKIIGIVTNDNFPRDREEQVAELRRMGVSEYVFIGTGMRADCGGQQGLEGIKENSDYLHREGFKTCAWKWTWFVPEEGYTRQVSAKGDVSGSVVCPSDEAFVAFCCDFMKRLAATGVDMILFDDDFSCFGYYNGPLACCCDNHLRLISEKVGEKVEREFLAEKLLSGGANAWRSAWIQVNGDLLRGFCRKVREAVDTVNPLCRIGICCSPAAWDFSADVSELAHILAGNTRPFLRLIGAPYWAAARQFGGFRMQDVIEHERCVAAYCDEDIELYAEGDTFPRPRFRCPASYLEAFHMALLADSRVDGIMKYGLDITSKAGYETGYTDLYRHNQWIYEEIKAHFTDKIPKGIYVLEAPRKYGNLEIPEIIREGAADVSDLVFCRSASLLAANTIPTAYSYTGCGTVAFGESAKYADETVLNGGMILDIFAAWNLERLGVDVGLKSVGRRIKPQKEYFIHEEDYVSLARGYGEAWTRRTEGYSAQLKENTMVQTRFWVNGQELPGSYLYENANGQRFLVFLFDGYFCGEGMFRMYTRGRQIRNSMKWLCGKELPAFCGGNPDLYMLYKENSGKAAVGLWNFSADPVLKPRIVLDRNYSKLTCINCEGVLEGNQVCLSKLYSNEFAGFAVE